MNIETILLLTGVILFAIYYLEAQTQIIKLKMENNRLAEKINELIIEQKK
jgi:hypothetical protein